MDRRRFLPTYHYEDNTDGVLPESVGKPLRDYKIYGNSIQDGTPSPEVPIEIQSIGDKTVNLFDKDNANYILGYFNRNSTALNTHAKARTVYIPCEPNTTYTISRNTAYTNFHFGYTTELPAVGIKPYNGVSADTITTTYLTITTGADAKYLIAYIYNGYAEEGREGGWELILDGIQIEKGNKTTEYEPFGYKVPIKVSGKNLFDKNAEFDATRGVYTPTVNIDGEAVTCSHDGRFNMLYIGAWAIRTDGNTEFTVSAKNISFLSNGGYFYIREADEIPTTIDISNMFGTQILMLTKNVNDYSYTLTTDKKYLFIICAPSNGGAVSFEELQIEYGETAMSYELYIEPQTTNIYLAEPLRKAGDIADYIDFKNRCVVRNTQKITLGSSLNSYTYTYSGMTGAGISNVIEGGGRRLIGLCTHSDKVGNILPLTANTIWCGDAGNTSLYWLGILDILGTDIPGFKQWLDEQEIPVEVICGRTTPIIEPIELPQIPTAKGTINIMVDTDIQPSATTWQYYRK